jgi:ribosome-associated protein
MKRTILGHVGNVGVAPAQTPAEWTTPPRVKEAGYGYAEALRLAPDLVRPHALSAPGAKEVIDLKASTAPVALAAPPVTLGLEHAAQCARIAEDNKARDIVVLDMRGVTPWYDFLVLATAASRRQLHAIAEEVDAYLASEGEKRLGIEGYQSCKWIVQDYGDLVLHLFDPPSREFYNLDELWADAKRIDWRRY